MQTSLCTALLHNLEAVPLSTWLGMAVSPNILHVCKEEPIRFLVIEQVARIHFVPWRDSDDMSFWLIESLAGLHKGGLSGYGHEVASGFYSRPVSELRYQSVCKPTAGY